MATLLRVIGYGLLVLAGMFVLAGLTDDAPGLIPIALLVAGIGAYALVGARDEDAHRQRTDALLERIAASLDRGDLPRG